MDQRSGSAMTDAAAKDERHHNAETSESEQDFKNEDEIAKLARRITTRSLGFTGSLFPPQGKLDPNSADFNARAWFKAFFQTRTDAADGLEPKTTGVAFSNLNVHGYGTATDFQKTAGNVMLDGVSIAKKILRAKQNRVDILRNCEGLLRSGEMLAVLGPPGSGCSTFLKTIAGDTHGFKVAPDASITYDGIPPKQMSTAFRGEVIYTAEVDHHYPQMTVADTLYFAARARTPRTIPEGVSRQEYAEHLRDVIMAMFGISHTKNTRVGNDFVRGVSGGERKRVTIAEAALSYAPLQCWDNSTRGLDSANAIEFVRSLRIQADVMGTTACVAIYQAPEAAYKVFDKVLVLYEGRQIFFGKADEGKAYFEGLGFACPHQQTTADFLTSMTNPQERVVKQGWEGRTPRSSDEFAELWRASSHRAALMEEIQTHSKDHPFEGERHQKFLEAQRLDKSKHQRERSPYLLSYWGQIKLTLWRCWIMLKGDPSVTITMLLINVMEALVVASVFYNLPDDSSSLYRRGLLLFYAVLLNAFACILEIFTLYSKRSIIEKHARYSFYHPSTEALSSFIMDLPYKLVNSSFVNLTIYFMGNLRRDPGRFFFYYLISFCMVICMSLMFRFIGSISKSIAQALAPTSILLQGLILYSGFAIPIQYMLGWIRWFRWLNPIYYGLESVYINEFENRNFPCTVFTPSGPGYGSISGSERICNAIGSISGEEVVSGQTYVESQYDLNFGNKWRNFGVLIAWSLLFLVMHLLASEYITSARSKGEVLLFKRTAMKNRQAKLASDLESNGSSRIEKPEHTNADEAEAVRNIEKQTAIFHWKDVCYDIKIKGEPRRILDRVDGWVKPGTLTALMGVSGAGKTTLLDALASRITTGVITGEMLVNGALRDQSFQRKTGYAQQQDLHLHTSTVREALNFSALLRQPDRYSKEEKLAYVDNVIKLLNMEEYSDAIVGVPGEGLNVEQRKRLTIGVELAARPQLLLFLDEPTSGLDSQTSWSICQLMRKLTDSGQAILCTIHQPSALLFQSFDRLLLLASGGRTVYFGDIGKNSAVLTDYFVRHGSSACPPDANPAEWMLEVIGAAPGSHTEINWSEVWRTTPEYHAVQDELASLAAGGSNRLQQVKSIGHEAALREYAAPFGVQVWEVTKRVFEQYWRSPAYIWSKAVLVVGCALFIGLSFINAERTIRGLTNQMFAVFIFLVLFGQIIQQIMPMFISQRTMYEARERPSKAYSWKAFMIAQIAVELFWNSVVAVLAFFVWYFPIGLYRNAEFTDAVHSRGVTTFLFVWLLLIFASTFADMLIAGFDSDEVAGAVGTLFMILMFTFNGVLATPDQLPGFWIFMYRVNPFTYVVDGFLGTALANAPVSCATNEILTFNSPANTTCGSYLARYIEQAGGYVLDPDVADVCNYCPMASTNDFLSSLSISYGNRWRDFGILWVYIVFNIGAAVFIYWLARVPKGKKEKEEEKAEKNQTEEAEEA